MRPSTPRSVVRVQDRLVRLLGTAVEGRPALVASMLRRDASESTSYWLQLVVSVGIASLGLVVGSTAVVIGAMLVAPLMGPIVGLAMGLATGSPFLVLRSAGRIGLSVAAAVGGAAAITLMLPFHELNAEILARASPTVLDLITAGFCALAGVYASLRPGSDTTAAAAGTSISISLVPPLCASGFGVGTAAWGVAGGAALLFLTNLVAIVVVGTVGFVASGFNRVNVVTLERNELGREGLEGKDAPIARALAKRLSRLFESRWGSVWRFLMPFALVAAVYVPLRSALDEVAWQVRVRTEVLASIAREPARVVQSRIRVERHEVEIVLVLLGKTQDAERARVRLDAEIRQVSGVVPHIEILAVPDASAFAGLESTLLTPRTVKAPVVAPPPTALEQLVTAQTLVGSAVTALWPVASAGAPLTIEASTREVGPLRVRVTHLGAPLGPDGTETLRRALSAKLGRDTELVDAPLPAAVIARPVGDLQGDLQFVAAVAAGLRAAADVPNVSVCVTRPEPPPPRRRVVAADVEMTRFLEATLAQHPRVTSVTGSGWSVRFVIGACPSPAGPSELQAPAVKAAAGAPSAAPAPPAPPKPPK